MSVGRSGCRDGEGGMRGGVLGSGREREVGWGTRTRWRGDWEGEEGGMGKREVGWGTRDEGRGGLEQEEGGADKREVGWGTRDTGRGEWEREEERVVKGSSAIRFACGE